MRIRTVKPEFFTHEGLFELEHETKLPLRISFVGLWCAADKSGRFKWEPRRLGIQILPYDLIDFSRVLDALASRGFVVKYEWNGSPFGFIPTFNRHQVINNKERESQLPSPDDCEVFNASPTRQPRVDIACQGEGKGREGNMEGNGKDSLSDESDGVTYSDFIETIWPIFPPMSRNRSSKAKLDKAWKVTKSKPNQSAVISCLQKWAQSHAWTKDGGQFAPGAHVWVKDRKWESEPEQVTGRVGGEHKGLFEPELNEMGF